MEAPADCCYVGGRGDDMFDESGIEWSVESFAFAFGGSEGIWRQQDDEVVGNGLQQLDGMKNRKHLRYQ